MFVGLGVRTQLLYTSSPAALFAAGEVGAWYDPSDLSTMFQDSAGTTPVTAVGQPVGLRLDKSKGLVLGPELVTNGDFSSGAANWITNTGWVIAGGVASYTAGTASGLFQSKALSAATRYLVTFTKTGTGSVSIRLGTGGATQATFTSEGNLSAIVQPDGTGFVGFFANNSGNFTIDNVSVRELPGNHASQSTSGSRAIYASVPKGGRRNLLTYTSFEGAVAGTPGTFPTAFPSNSSGGSIVSVSGGTIVFSANGARQICGPSVTITANSTEMWSVTVTENSGLAFNQLFYSINTQAATVTSYANGAVVNATTYVPAAGDRLSIKLVNGATDITGAVFRMGVGVSGVVTGKAGFSQPQRELGSTATNYQRVGSIYDITEAGVQTLYGLLYDGLDDFYVTSTITPGTDKVQVFAGVRKLSDAARGILAEFSADINTNNGTFAIEAPDANAATSYRPRSKGTVSATIGGLSAYAAPISSVLSTLASISDDSLIQRVNGSQAGSSATDQGTGNYGAYPLYIGRRGGTSLPYNGYEFGLIVRFGPNLSTAQTASVEGWLNTRTGAY